MKSSLWYSGSTPPPPSGGNSAHFPLSLQAPWRPLFEQVFFLNSILHRFQNINGGIFSLPHNANILLLDTRATG